ncbi:MAG TPA: hypothetical protein VMD97_03775 [Candidatus Aquilonibacter sp.]|nr:hypothetical protein [Candidatus Aquilonibacter sp.]
MPYTGRIEYANERQIREWNKPHYRLAHWPIWIWVFFLLPGPLTFRLFAGSFGWRNLAWLGAVLAGTGVAGVRGQLPGVEPRPYILRFDEDRANPLYRRVCYTFAWSALLTFAAINLLALAIALVTGTWRTKQLYQWGYAPLCAVVLVAGVAGVLPRAGVSTKGEGTERRYFYTAVWSVTAAQTLLLVMWKALPLNRKTAAFKLASFTATLVFVGLAGLRGLLPRTKPIVAGAWIEAD